MNIVVVNCPDCGKELEIDCNFKKSICKYCGTSFDTKKAIKVKELNNVIESAKVNNNTIEENILEIDKLIKEDRLEEAKNLIRNVSKNTKSDLLILRKLKIDLKEYNEDEYKLLKTVEQDNDEYWGTIRNILKVYNSISNKNIIDKELNENEIKLINNLSDYYKKMIIDKELCEKIDNCFKKYFDYYDGLSNFKRNISLKKEAEFFKNKFGISMNKYYGIKRDMTVKYKHYGDNKHVYSRLSKFKDLNEVFQTVNENYDNFVEYLGADNGYMHLIIGVIFIIILLITLLIVFI